MPEASTSGSRGSGATARVRAGRRWGLFLGLAGSVAIVDQVTKLWVDASFGLASRSVPAGEPGGPTEVLGDLVRIAKTYNDGAIFGLLEASAPILALVTIGVVLAITWYEWRHGATSGLLVTAGLGTLLGGAIGNLIDRLRLGHVIDFVDVGLGSARWYAFNVSDAAVFVGVLLLFAAALLGDRAAWGREPAAGAPGSASSRSAPPPGGRS